MTPDEAFRWDGAAPTELTMWLGRLGFVLVIVGVVLALVSIF